MMLLWKWINYGKKKICRDNVTEKKYIKKNLFESLR